MQPSLIQALGIINCAILKRIEGKQFRVIHCDKDWFYSIAPEAKDSEVFEFAGNSAYLDDFFIDAEEFWRNSSEGQIHSGIWSEQTEDQLLRLEALAAVSNGDSYLVINNLEGEYQKQRKTLQAARELLISNDKVLAQHEYIHERLDQVLRENQTLQTLQKPIKRVIENADIGVVITDAQLNVIIQNPNSYSVFETSDLPSEASPFKKLLELFKNQCVEFERVIGTSSRWHGELFWHNPPYSSKWLKLALYPVTDENQNLQHWIFIFSDVSRVKYLLQRNEKLNLYDNVTNLPNRQFFWQKLEYQIEKAKPFFIVYLDVKHFKQINELHGHQAGDQILVTLAERIQQCISTKDLCARVGGNEFGIILTDCKEQNDCVEVANRLIESIQPPFYTASKQKVQIGLNLGAAHFPSDASNSEDLMKFADLAMFSAKKEDKSKLCFYSIELKEASQYRLELESALKDAISKNQFELFLQPIVDLNTGQVAKAEALIRWRLADGNLTSPDKFIPIAEQTGLIVPIGKWVISRATEMLKVIMQYEPELKISVNLSPRQVADRHLFDFVTQAIDHSGVPAKNLELELTEGVLIDNYDKVKLLLDQVRNIGISTSIDDFGTGYSSLSYLQKLPIDNLKIDRSFIIDLEQNENDKAIILAVIAMAHSLKLGVVAEGVENQYQADFLLDNRCTVAQGYLFSRPLPFDEFCELLIAKKHANKN
ncbi:bifunctional diguanylate cyclase/phosphodiesterase [Aliiglaciecola sp. 3_MG-2023]|uniref:putative bifunctional diguanylate cyclase/phosphodiesterase n=1 Tax=Aliiglaciecola sp. 3_MG-2023 TaxID=3062644 RepID=UPI0026E2FE11|nr:bifunctional diguanylate cyclase/phosphodiesterase [Aliiglaciecola sp. 3_MG-2023]MDO6694882.1 bifunctional diguanylate cyclase/phosphodiesterase [Aliiglaciecola sp. 3_MG-2023]